MLLLLLILYVKHVTYIIYGIWYTDKGFGPSWKQTKKRIYMIYSIAYEFVS